MQKSDFTLKGLKTLNTPDGRAYNCSLAYQGKKMAEVHYAGNGGEVLIRYADPKFENTFRAWLKALPPLASEYSPEGLQWNDGLFIDELVDDVCEKKALDRISKKKTIFRLKGDEVGIWRELNKVGPDAVLWAVNKYGDKIELIYGVKI